MITTTRRATRRRRDRDWRLTRDRGGQHTENPLWKLEPRRRGVDRVEGAGRRRGVLAAAEAAAAVRRVVLAPAATAARRVRRVGRRCRLHGARPLSQSVRLARARADGLPSGVCARFDNVLQPTTNDTVRSTNSSVVFLPFFHLIIVSSLLPHDEMTDF